MKQYVLISILVIGSIFGGFVVLNKRDGTPSQQPVNTVQILPTATPTPFPFQELTIPYLRNRTYTSTLGSKQVAYTTSSYTAYITSYTSDGLTIQGLLTEPKGQMPDSGWPAVVFIHGYIPPAQYKTTQQYYDYVDYIARNGFVVFKIDLRGHGSSDGEPSGAYYSGDYVIDTLHAYSALSTSSTVNPNQIGLWGHSMAGNIVMRSAAVRTDIPAVVIWAGAVYTYEDMQKLGIQDGSYQPPPSTSQRQQTRQRLRDTYGNFDPAIPFWQQFPVTNYLGELQGAVQLNHAINDSVVSIEYSRNLNSLLNNTAVIHELNEYTSGGHNINGPAFSEAMQNTVTFYKTHLTK